MHESSSLAAPSSSTTAKRAQQWPKDILHLVSARGLLQAWLSSGDSTKSASGISPGLKLVKSIKSIKNYHESSLLVDDDDDDENKLRIAEGETTDKSNKDSEMTMAVTKSESKDTSGLSRVRRLREGLS